MARFTSIGMPRKSFVASAAEETRPPREAGPSSLAAPSGEDGEVKKKKTHRAGRRNRPKRDGEATQDLENAGGVQAKNGESAVAKEGLAGGGKTSNKEKRKNVKREREGEAAGKGWGRDPSIAHRASLNAAHAEARRAKRIDNRHASTTCFACRSVGHAAKDCPNVLLASRGQGGEDLGETAGDEAEGKAGMGIKRKRGQQGGEVTGGKCYRCNSVDHSLSQCPEKADPADPTPFATCFICLKSGHLSSLCPANTERGIYVNGGSCKLCGSVAHRAKDCPTLPENDGDARASYRDRDRKAKRDVVLGLGDGAGADEDDFMVQARQLATVAEPGKRRKHAPARNGERGVKKAVDEGGYAPAPGPVLAPGEPVAPGSSEAKAAQVPVAVKPVVKAKPKVISF